MSTRFSVIISSLPAGLTMAPWGLGAPRVSREA